MKKIKTCRLWFAQILRRRIVFREKGLKNGFATYFILDYQKPKTSLVLYFGCFFWFGVFPPSLPDDWKLSQSILGNNLSGMWLECALVVFSLRKSRGSLLNVLIFADRNPAFVSFMQICCWHFIGFYWEMLCEASSVDCLQLMLS